MIRPSLARAAAAMVWLSPRQRVRATSVAASMSSPSTGWVRVVIRRRSRLRRMSDDGAPGGGGTQAIIEGYGAAREPLGEGVGSGAGPGRHPLEAGQAFGDGDLLL